MNVYTLSLIDGLRALRKRKMMKCSDERLYEPNPDVHPSFHEWRRVTRYTIVEGKCADVIASRKMLIDWTGRHVFLCMYPKGWTRA